MVANYFALLTISLLAAAVGIFLAVLGTVRIRKWFLSKKGGTVIYVIFLCVFLTLAGLGMRYTVPCLGDLPYVTGETYEEAVGLVMGFDEAHYDADGNGRVNYSRPIFYLEETKETLILPAKGVTLGKRYLLRYYPHTKITEVVKEMT